MSERITIILDSDLIRKIRTIQADIIKKESKSCSFSKVLTIILERGLKNEQN